MNTDVDLESIDRLMGRHPFFQVVTHVQGQTVMALNGGSQFKFTETISFLSCETQAEVDGLWEKLSSGGTKQR